MKIYVLKYRIENFDDFDQAKNYITVVLYVEENLRLTTFTNLFLECLEYTNLLGRGTWHPNKFRTRKKNIADT